MKFTGRQIGIAVGSLILVALFLFAYCTAVRAEDPCPKPTPLSCNRLMQLSELRHCLPETPPCKAVPCDAVPCNQMPCEIKPCEERDCKPTVVTAYIDIPHTPPTPHAKWIAGGGPLYSAGWGATAVIGGTWPSGWTLLVGPTWIPRNSTSGMTTCMNGGTQDRGGDHDSYPGNECVPMGYSVPARSAWGGQALVLKSW